MPKQLPKPRGVMPDEVQQQPKPKRRGRREPIDTGAMAERREALREREEERAARATDGETHERFMDVNHEEGTYDDGGSGVSWLHEENPEVWNGSICDV